MILRAWGPRKHFIIIINIWGAQNILLAPLPILVDQLVATVLLFLCGIAGSLSCNLPVYRRGGGEACLHAGVMMLGGCWSP